MIDAYEHPSVSKGLLIKIDASMYHHLVITEDLSDVSLSRGWGLAESLKFGPNLLLEIEFIDVAEGSLFASATASEHDQTVVHLNLKVSQFGSLRYALNLKENLHIHRCESRGLEDFQP